MPEAEHPKVPVLRPEDYNGDIRLEKDGHVLVIGKDAPKYVLFSDVKGIFLGDGAWSYDAEEAKNHNRALTYPKFLVDNLQQFLKTKGVETIQVQVEPDCKFGMVSRRNLIKAGLPPWDYDAETHGPDPMAEDDDVEAIDGDEPAEAQEEDG